VSRPSKSRANNHQAHFQQNKKHRGVTQFTVINAGITLRMLELGLQGRDPNVHLVDCSLNHQIVIIKLSDQGNMAIDRTIPQASGPLTVGPCRCMRFRHYREHAQSRHVRRHSEDSQCPSLHSAPRGSEPVELQH
jgi:hypothetical protein